MSRPLTSEILPERLADHRAVKAWRQIQPEWSEPEKIEILKLKRKTSVYRLSGGGLNGSASIAKRCRTPTATVERAVYDEFLPSLPMPAVRCRGFVPEPEGEFCWLFLEDAGTDAYSPASEEHRVLAGQWLGTLHRARLSADFQALLPDRGTNHYLQLLRATQAGLGARFDNPVLPADDVAMLRNVVAQCAVVEAHWDELERFCPGLPRTLVHGDFVVKNLRLGAGSNGPALLVFDWEMAGWGVPATDLAQFLGDTVTPDLEAYGSLLRQDFPQLDVHDIQRLADYGNLLRLVDKIFWETKRMVGDSYEFLLRSLTTVRLYEPQLASALRAAGWS